MANNQNVLSGQPDGRRAARLTDQHGRKWSAVIEIKTGVPTGPLTPLGWKAPLLVPMKYFKFNALEPSMVTIDYGEWIADLEESKRSYDRKLVERAQKMFGTEAGKIVRKPTPELLAVMGEPPSPVEPVQAAASGNRWVLGLTDAKPDWAKKFFPDEPVRRRRRSTGSVGRAEIEEAWREQFPDAEEAEV